MRRGFVAALIALFGLLASVGPAAAQLPGAPPPSQRVILSFGNDQFIPKSAAESLTGARFQSDFSGLRYLDDASVIVLADIAYAQLPAVLQASLGEWVNLGGSLLVTGGNNAFGFGGYAGTPLGGLLPLRPGSTDTTGHGFSPTYVLNPAHPVFAGVTTATMANFNETSMAGDATPLLEYRGASKGGAAGGGMTGSGRTFITTVNPRTGQPQVTLGTPAQSRAGQVTNPVTGQTVAVGPGSGTVSSGAGGAGQSGVFPGTTSGGEGFNPGFGTEGGIQGGGRATFPLMAERRQGKGTVLAIALDMNATGEWRDRETFAVNVIRYLLDQSQLPNR